MTGKQNKNKKIDIKSKAKSSKTKPITSLQTIRNDVAGIDLGSESHFVAASEKLGEVTTREFGIYTPDLEELANWLKQCGVKAVAMESTGVYWMHIYDFLDQKGFKVDLIDAHKTKNVNGKKTDVKDAEWIRQLYSYGLLEGSFIPETATLELRTYLRLREQIVQEAATCIQRMQKALIRMNIRIDKTLSDICGETGLRIISAILDGERDPKKLAKLRDGRCKKSVEEIEASLIGNYLPDQLFSLRMQMDKYKYLKEEISKCDIRIFETLSSFEDKMTETESYQKKSSGAKRDFPFDLQLMLIQKTGVDLTELPGIGVLSALKILSETGFDMSKWKSAKHFASWLGLSPNNKKSGGKTLRSSTKKCKNRASITFRISVNSLYREANNSAIGCFTRRKKMQIGKPQGITAGAHKLAKAFYNSLVNKKTFVEPGVDAYTSQQEKNYLKRTRRKLQKMGFEIHSKAA